MPLQMTLPPLSRQLQPQQALHRRAISKATCRHARCGRALSSKASTRTSICRFRQLQPQQALHRREIGKVSCHRRAALVSSRAALASSRAVLAVRAIKRGLQGRKTTKPQRERTSHGWALHRLRDAAVACRRLAVDLEAKRRKPDSAALLLRQEASSRLEVCPRRQWVAGLEEPRRNPALAALLAHQEAFSHLEACRHLQWVECRRRVEGLAEGLVSRECRPLCQVDLVEVVCLLRRCLEDSAVLLTLRAAFNRLEACRHRLRALVEDAPECRRRCSREALVVGRSKAASAALLARLVASNHLEVCRQALMVCRLRLTDNNHLADSNRREVCLLPGPAMVSNLATVSPAATIVDRRRLRWSLSRAKWRSTIPLVDLRRRVDCRGNSRQALPHQQAMGKHQDGRQRLWEWARRIAHEVACDRESANHRRRVLCLRVAHDHRRAVCDLGLVSRRRHAASLSRHRSVGNTVRRQIRIGLALGRWSGSHSAKCRAAADRWAEAWAAAWVEAWAEAAWAEAASAEACSGLAAWARQEGWARLEAWALQEAASTASSQAALAAEAWAEACSGLAALAAGLHSRAALADRPRPAALAEHGPVCLLLAGLDSVEGRQEGSRVALEAAHGHRWVEAALAEHHRPAASMPPTLCQVNGQEGLVEGRLLWVEGLEERHLLCPALEGLVGGRQALRLEEDSDHRHRVALEAVRREEGLADGHSRAALEGRRRRMA